jgi:hypothetical protein
MPIIDLEGCRPTWGRERPSGLQLDNLFARPSSLPIAVQVMGSPSGSMLQPFVLVERFFADQRLPVGFISDQQINGSGVRIDWNERTGHGGLSWLLPDGSEAYLRTASLSQEELLDLARALIPRPIDATVPGFDLPTAPPFGLAIIDETYGALESSAMVQSQCEFADGPWLGVSLIDPGVLWRAALILDRSSALPLVLRDLTDGRLLFITGRPDSAAYMQGIEEHIRGATPAEHAALLTYPAPGELNPWELPVDEEAHDRMANRTFANTDEISAAVISILQERVPAVDAPETRFTTIELSANSELVITMNYLDDSVVAAQWLVRYQGPAGALNVYAVHRAIKCRDGSAHPPDYAECP